MNQRTPATAHTGRFALVVTLAAVALAIGGHAQETARLSEVEQLRLRLLRTETALEQALSQTASCRAQFRSLQLTLDEAALKADVETNHPGYRFDPKTGDLAKPPTATAPGGN